MPAWLPLRWGACRCVLLLAFMTTAAALRKVPRKRDMLVEDVSRYVQRT